MIFYWATTPYSVLTLVLSHNSIFCFAVGAYGYNKSIKVAYIPFCMILSENCRFSPLSIVRHIFEYSLPVMFCSCLDVFLLGFFAPDLFFCYIWVGQIITFNTLWEMTSKHCSKHLENDQHYQIHRHFTLWLYTDFRMVLCLLLCFRMLYDMTAKVKVY